MTTSRDAWKSSVINSQVGQYDRLARDSDDPLMHAKARQARANAEENFRQAENDLRRRKPWK